MDAKRWQSAAWLAVAVAALMPLSFIMSIVCDTVMKGRPQALPFAIMVAVVNLSWMLSSLIVLVRFRELLNERYRFHAVDTLIQALLVLLPILALVGAIGRIVTVLPWGRSANLALTLSFALPMILGGVCLGVLSILIGARLLRFEGDAAGLIRPYAIVSIAGGACFVSLILIPLAGLAGIAEHVLLALLFFRAAESEAAVEFV